MKKISIIFVITIFSITIYFHDSLKSYYYYIQLPSLDELDFTETSLNEDIVNYTNNELHINIPDHEIRGKKIVSTQDGYYIMGLYTHKKINRVFLIKFSNAAHFQWGRTYSIHNDKLVGKHIFLSDNGLVITGAHINNKTLVNSFVLKTDLDGNLLWGTILGTRETGNILSQTIQIDDGYLTTGVYHSGSNVSYGKNNIQNHINTKKIKQSIWIVKLDQRGKKIWENLYAPDEQQYGKNINKQGDNFIIVTGPQQNSHEISINSNGEILSVKKAIPKRFSSISNPDWGLFNKADLPKTIFVETLNNNNFIISKRTKHNLVDWNYSIQQFNRSDLVQIIETKDGGCLINNFRYEFLKGNSYLIRLDSFGNEKWKKHFQNEGGRYVLNDNTILSTGEYVFLAEVTFNVDYSFSTNNSKNKTSFTGKVSGAETVVIKVGKVDL